MAGPVCQPDNRVLVDFIGPLRDPRGHPCFPKDRIVCIGPRVGAGSAQDKAPLAGVNAIERVLCAARQFSEASDSAVAETLLLKPMGQPLDVCAFHRRRSQESRLPGNTADLPVSAKARRLLPAQIRSMIVAFAIPPASHMVCSP